MSQSSNEQAESELKETPFGSGEYSVLLPLHYTVEVDDEGTTVFFDPAYDDAIARISELTLEAKDPSAVDIGMAYVLERAKEENIPVKEANGAACYSYIERTDEDDANFLHWWVIGVRNSMIMISCWVKESAHDLPVAKEVLKQVQNAVNSFRTATFHQQTVDDINPEISELTQADKCDLNEWRKSVAASLSQVPSFSSSKSSSVNLKMLQYVLSFNDPKVLDTFLLEGLGVVFGDLIAEELGLHWVSYKDKYGATAALQHKNSSIILHPKDMIIKRIERNEIVDLSDLYEKLVQHVKTMVASGEYD